MKIKRQPKGKINTKRLSLHGHNPEDAIKAFMQVPVMRLIKKEQNQRNKSG
jgi:hypothetical protein